MSVSCTSASRGGGYLGVSTQLCHCGAESAAWIAGTPKNAGRLFLKCKQDRCEFWSWVNDLPRLPRVNSLVSTRVLDAGEGLVRDLAGAPTDQHVTSNAMVKRMIEVDRKINQIRVVTLLLLVLLTCLVFKMY